MRLTLEVFQALRQPLPLTILVGVRIPAPPGFREIVTRRNLWRRLRR